MGQETTIRTKHGTMDWVKIGTEYNEAVYFHLSINVYEDQESTVRITHETRTWFQIGKGVHQGLYTVTLLI